MPAARYVLALKRNRGWRPGLLILLLIVLWFALIQRVEVLDTCAVCGYARIVAEYRMAGVLVSRGTRLESPSLINEVALRLRLPHAHTNQSRSPLRRFWGLLYCAGPCENGTFLVDGDRARLETNAQKTVDRASANPRFREEFEEKVLHQGDRDYWRRVSGRDLETSERDRHLVP